MSLQITEKQFAMDYKVELEKLGISRKKNLTRIAALAKEFGCYYVIMRFSQFSYSPLVQ